MDKKEALEICRDMWNYLANNPNHDKAQALYYLNLPMMYNDCSCCEYTSQHMSKLAGKERFGVDCKYCPIEWPDLSVEMNDEDGSYEQTPCEKSYYRLWVNLYTSEDFKSEATKNAARAISDLAVKALKKLENNEKSIG